MKYALGTIVGTALLGLAKPKIGSNIRLTKKKVKVITIKDRRFYTYYENSIEDTNTEELIYQDINQYISDSNIVHSEYEECEAFPYVTYEIYEDEGDLLEEEGEDYPWTYTLKVNVHYTYLEKDKESESEAQSQLATISEDINDIVKRHVNWSDTGTLHGDNASQREVDIIVNADTGEEYKPKAKSSRLRKR
jgi:hypothetical protein